MVADVQELIRTSRLVTLTGTGGVGKTRVALRVARDERMRGEYAVWVVELSPLQDAVLLPHTVAAALGLPDQTARLQLEVLADFLADRTSLLVLDCCEHLLDTVAEFVAALLYAAPGLTVLVTSRQVLGVPGERRVVIEPLPLPDDEPAVRPADGDGDALDLLIERAAEARAGSVPAPGDRADLVRLRHRLEGIPLAIELAAVQLRTLSVAQMLERLEDRRAARRRGGGARTAPSAPYDHRLEP